MHKAYVLFDLNPGAVVETVTATVKEGRLVREVAGTVVSVTPVEHAAPPPPQAKTTKKKKGSK